MTKYICDVKYDLYEREYEWWKVKRGVRTSFIIKANSEQEAINEVNLRLDIYEPNVVEIKIHDIVCKEL